jgi:CubicO group peptidase (beta-lactamase class C family)
MSYDRDLENAMWEEGTGPIDRLISRYMDYGTFPGGVLLVGTDKEVILEKAYGYRAIYPEREENATDTVYDLASLTKVVATTPAIMRLLEWGEIRLWDPVKRFLPEFSTGLKEDVRVFHLLTHTSGLPPYSNAWRYTQNSIELKEELLKTELAYKTGTNIVYSCLNFIFLGYIVERITQKSLDRFVREQIFTPLKMVDTSYLPEDASKVAPTCERDGKILRGEPDDELAYYQGGVSGNAGLFSTARDLYKYARSLINPEYYIFSPYTVEAFTKEYVSYGEEKKGLGWMIKSINSSCGDLFSERSFGHTGYTGTSLWIDPVKRLIVIFLCNRTHLSRKVGIKDESSERIIEFRPRLHNVIVASMYRH